MGKRLISCTLFFSQWKIKYNCDSGYEPFGDDVAECRDGEWTPSTDDLPKCAVNVAQNKPADASSQSDGGHPGKLSNPWNSM